MEDDYPQNLNSCESFKVEANRAVESEIDKDLSSVLLWLVVFALVVAVVVVVAVVLVVAFLVFCRLRLRKWIYRSIHSMAQTISKLAD